MSSSPPPPSDRGRVPSPPPGDRGPGAPAGGRYDVDVAIVGAGVAGLYAAHRLRELTDARIVIIDKGEPGPSGSSPWAQGGVAVSVGPDDDPELHAEDTIRAGDGLCDPRAVDVLTREGPAALERLLALGAEFDRAPGGGLHLAREGGQRVARSVHRADTTGAEMVRVLRAAVVDEVHRLPGIVISLAVDAGEVRGAWVLTDDGPASVRARAVLLASGGCGGLYAATTNPDRATGDGLSLAWRAGAALRDLEFVQFHPTGLAPTGGPEGWRLLLTEALRGAGATLHDRDGRRFLIDVHPEAELAPRHVVSRAILSQPGGIAYLDATRLGAERLEEEFPTAVEGARSHGIDLATERAPVTPAAHYQVGGVRTDLDGRTSLPRLWAAGEVASTGAHGANRMAGNSLLEALVFGGRAAAAMTVEGIPTGDDTTSNRGPALATEGPTADQLTDLRRRLRRVVWDGCGPVRTRGSLADAAASVADLVSTVGVPTADPQHIELVHAVTAASLLIRSAALRTETRGVHVRDDHPDADPAWADTHIELVRT